MADQRDSDDDLAAVPSAPVDSLEAVLAQAVAAPARYPGLERGVVVAGRYEVEGELGAGGMGTVYVARDRELDRTVALKLHHAHGGAGADRLRREAIAMAKLAHPNVVTVFEVGEVDGRAFVAMEYVPGETLRAWLGDRARSQREIVAALLAAGEGLAAAHAADLVHRDVKPDNIFIGDDGRVRIGDFGLAQVQRLAGAAVRVPIGATTATGTVVGTPAYMAPEQIDGAPVDARTDQFAFCVAAWEALGGERPFAGQDTEQLRSSIERVELITPGRRFPAAIRRVLVRGMAVAPDARWPSMHALLAGLRAAQRRPRVLAGVVVGGLVVAGVATWVAWPATDPAAVCATAGAEIDTVLPTGLVDAAGAVAPREATLIAAAAATFRGEHRRIARSACEARARKQWSPELLRASNECLAYHARTARELFTVAPTLATSPSDVVEIVARLPSLRECDDARRLAGWQSLATDPTELEAIVAARSRLAAGSVLVDLYQLAPARAIRDDLAASPLRAPAVRERVQLLRGQIAAAEHVMAEAEQVVTDVYFAGRSRDDAELVLEAARALIDLTGRVRRDYKGAQRWIRDGLAEAERLRAVAPERAAAVYLAAATVAIDHGDPDEALTYAARAEQLAGETAIVTSAVLDLRASAYAELGKMTDALAILDEVASATRAQVGDDHPRIAVVLAQRAAILLAMNRAKEAAVTAKQAMAILDRAGTDASSVIATAEHNLGATLLQIGDNEAARTYLTRARARWVASFGEDHPDVALVDTNLALLYLDAGETDRALASLRHATAVQERLLGPDHDELAAGLFNLAVAERNANQLDAALATAGRCLDIFARSQPGSTRHANAQTHVAFIQSLRGQPEPALAAAVAALAVERIDEDPMAGAWARLEAGRALAAMRRESARARALLVEARSRYTAEKYVQRVEEIDKLLATLR